MSVHDPAKFQQYSVIFAKSAADTKNRMFFRYGALFMADTVPRAFETACGPLGPEGRSLTENMPFGGFSTGLRRLNQFAAMAEIPVSGGLAAIFAKLEFAGLLNRQRWAAQRPGYAPR